MTSRAVLTRTVAGLRTARGTVEDDVAMDVHSDNLDEDECIEERDSDMARGSAKAISLARAAIAEADHQEKGDNEAGKRQPACWRWRKIENSTRAEGPKWNLGYTRR